MRRLAAGEVDLDVPGKERRDEVGEMAQAVDVFKQNAVERRRLEAETVANRVAADAERERVSPNDDGWKRKPPRTAPLLKPSASASPPNAPRRPKNRLKWCAGSATALRSSAAGDLTIRLGDGFTAAYAQIREDFNEAVDTLKETLLAVVSSTGTIESSSKEISSASDDLARRSEQQAAALEETASALTEITATVKKSAEGAGHAREVVASADEDAKKSAVVVREAVDGDGRHRQIVGTDRPDYRRHRRNRLPDQSAWRSTRASRRRGRATPAAALRWSLPRCGRWRSARRRRPRRSRA